MTGVLAPELTPIEKAAAETDLHFLSCGLDLGTCVECMGKVRVLRRQLAKAVPLIEEAARGRQLLELEEAGRLLPDGCRVRMDWLVRWYGPPDRMGEDGSVDWGCDSLERARKAAQYPPNGALRGEILTQHSWTSQWSRVETVTVSGEGSS